MTRDEKIAEARRLYDDPAWTYDRIGRKLGVSKSAVVKWLNPERAKEWARRQEARPERKAAKRAWERDPANRANCSDCGALLAQGSRVASGQGKSGLCRSCYATKQRVERGHQLERWWAEGLSLEEIRQRLGWSEGSNAAVAINRYRRYGFDLPYRYQLSKPKHPELKAAA